MAAGTERAPLAWLPWAIGAIALILLVAFDLGPQLVFNDEWLFQYSVRELIAGHGLRVYPLTAPLALPQVLFAVAAGLGHTDLRVLRLTIVPFVLLGSACSYRLATGFEAGPFWSGVAGVTLLGTPLFLTTSTAFMSDTPYLALLLAAAVAGTAWLARGKGRLACIGLTVAATLQRQAAVAIPLALTIGLLASRRERRIQTVDWVALLGMWVGAALAAVVPVVLHIATPAIGQMAGLGSGAATHLLPIILLPGMVGLCLVPFGTALALRPIDRPSEARPTRLIPVAISILAFTLVCALAIHFGRSVFPGNGWTREGFFPDLTLGKEIYFPDWVFVAVEVAALTTFAVAAVLRRRAWSPAALGPAGLFMVALAAGQFLPLLVLRAYPFDRYYLAIAAPLIPVAAGIAARTARPRASAAFAVVALAVGVAIYAAGEQDYQAWQVARDQAARLAYQTAPPSDVQAGYGANVTYYELPLFEKTGQTGWLYAGGPADPRVVLRFAPPGDPRPGADYHSLAPGRIVVVPQH